MTHEELLANIKYITGEFWVRINTNDSELLNAGDALSALKAVVELHKPDGSFCGHCSHDTEILETYPCPTIQAIEKALTNGTE